jgi:hypothetical protein
MGNIKNLVQTWKGSQSNLQESSFRDLFKDVLHKEPYCLRYSLDKKRDDLFMIYPTEQSHQQDPVVLQCNGIIFSKKTWNIVAYGSHGIVEGSIEDIRSMKDDPQRDPTSDLTLNYPSLEEAEDGTVLKVTFIDNEWIISTNKRIDASRVRWTSYRTFTDMFSDACNVPVNDLQDLLTRDLEKGFTYTFILLHPENRLVIPHEKPQLVLTSFRNLETLLEEPSRNYKNIPSWAQLQKSISVVEALEKLSLFWAFDRRGIIYSIPDASGNIIRKKVDYPCFKRANELRKNMPNMHQSYLACSFTERKEMKKLFGNMQIFFVIDEMMKELTKLSFNTYRDSFIKRYYKVPRDHPIYPILVQLHKLYRQTGEPVKMAHVRSVLDTLPVNIMDPILQFFSVYGFSGHFCKSDCSAERNNRLGEAEHIKTDSSGQVQEQTGHVEQEVQIVQVEQEVQIDQVEQQVQDETNKRNDKVQYLDEV